MITLTAEQAQKIEAALVAWKYIYPSDWTNDDEQALVTLHTARAQEQAEIKRANPIEHTTAENYEHFLSYMYGSGARHSAFLCQAYFDGAGVPHEEYEAYMAEHPEPVKQEPVCAYGQNECVEDVGQCDNGCLAAHRPRDFCGSSEDCPKPAEGLAFNERGVLVPAQGIVPNHKSNDPYNGDDGPGFDHEFHAKLLAGAHLLNDEGRETFEMGWKAAKEFFTAPHPMNQAEPEPVSEWERLKDPQTLFVNLNRGFPARLTYGHLLHLLNKTEQQEANESFEAQEPAHKWPLMGYGNVAIGGGKQPDGTPCLLYMDMGETREIGADTTDIFSVGSEADPTKLLACIYFKDGVAIQQTIDVLQEMQVEIGYTATPQRPWVEPSDAQLDEIAPKGAYLKDPNSVLKLSKELNHG